MGPGPGPGGHMGHMMQMSGPARQHGGHLGMMGGGGRDMGGNMANMPIRAGGPSINMRMPLDPHTGRMFHQGQGPPSPYPNPQMYMAPRTPLPGSNGGYSMGGHPHSMGPGYGGGGGG